MAYVQEPSKDVVEVRDLFATRHCLGVTAASHVDMALGDGARDNGALADEIPGDQHHAGIGFAIAPGSRLPIRFRAGLVTDADITELVRTCDTRHHHRRRDRPPRRDRAGHPPDRAAQPDRQRPQHGGTGEESAS